MNELAQWDELRTAIEQAQSIPELKTIRDRAEAFRYAAKLAGYTSHVAKKASEIKIRAERKAGTLLLGMPQKAQGAYKVKRSSVATFQIPTYEELDINKHEASKWQRIANIPDDAFETWMMSGKEISTSGALAIAKKHEQEKASFFRKESIYREVTGKYAVVLADPPWSYDDKAVKENRWGGAENHYRTLSTEQLCSFRLKYKDGEKHVSEIVEDDSLLFLWSTAPMLPDALKVMEAWGYSYRTVAFTWVKRNNDGSPFLGLGNWTRANSEYLLLGVKGKGVSVDDHSISSVVETMRLEHSEKPAEIRPRIEALVGEVPRIEIFARHRVKNWDCYGDQLED